MVVLQQTIRTKHKKYKSPAFCIINGENKHYLKKENVTSPNYFQLFLKNLWSIRNYSVSLRQIKE